MSWAWGATLDCDHKIAGEVAGNKTFVTPLFLGDLTFCPYCKEDREVVLTWGRGR